MMALRGRAIVAHAPSCVATAADEFVKDAPLVGSPSLGLPGIFELVEAATEAADEVSTLRTGSNEQREDRVASKESLLRDGTEEAVIEPEQKMERPDFVKPTELWNERVRLQDEHVKLLAHHKSVVHLVDSQQRRIEDLESDIDTLRSALKSQSVLLAEELSRPTAAASTAAKEAPGTPTAAPLKHQRHMQLQDDDEGASTEEEPDTDGSGMDSVGGAAEFYDSDTGSVCGAAQQLGRNNTLVVSASDFVATAYATQQQEVEGEELCGRSAFATAAYAVLPPLVTHLALLDNPLLPVDASLPATAVDEQQHAPRGPLPVQERQTVLAASSGTQHSSGRCMFTTTAQPQPPKRQLSARDVVAFGSMGFSWGIASYPEEEAKQQAYGVDGPAAVVEAARQTQGQHQETADAQEFDELAGVVTDEYAVEVAAAGMRVWRAKLEDELVADAAEAVGTDGMRRSPSSSANHGDVLAASLASYRSCKEGCIDLAPACHHRNGSWEVPVVVQEQQQSTDPLHGTMLGTLYRMFSS